MGRSRWPRGLRRESAGIAGSNPAGSTVVNVVCFQVEVCLRRADHSSGGVLPSVCGLEAWTETKPWLTRGFRAMEKENDGVSDIVVLYNFERVSRRCHNQLR